MRHQSKNRILLILLLLFYSFESLYCQTEHCYALGEYYYLNLKDSVNYELKIGMYGNQNLYGNYLSHNDTLVFETHNFIDQNEYLSERERNNIIERFGKYLIKDSLLIPICFYEMEIPALKRNPKDSNLMEIYTLSDGHSYYTLKLKSDFIFSYQTSGGREKIIIEGKWLRREENLILFPKTKNHLETLKWIATDYRLKVYDNFIVGKATGKNRYMYLLKR